MSDQMTIRNGSIAAHINHGKFTPHEMDSFRRGPFWD